MIHPLTASEAKKKRRECVANIEAIFAEYSERCGDTEPYNLVGDILTDLRHYCASKKLPFAKRLSESKTAFKAESTNL